MKSIIYYFSMISIFFFLSCTGWKDKKNMESDIITVNLDERDEISTKDLFSEIQLIPLETTPESLIRNITQIKFFEDRYYIHDYSRSQIFVFDREGHFQFALNEKGNGPGGGKFIEIKKLPEIAGAYNSLQFQNKDTIAFFTYDYDHRLKFYSLSRNEILDEYFPEDIKDVFCRGVFPFPHAFRRSLTNTIYSLSGATFTELYRWDFGDLNNDIEKLEFHPNMSKQEIIQYAKDVYSSKSVNYIIDSQGQNSRYRYAMVVRQNKYIQLFYNRKNHDLLQFERTKEGLQLYPIYFGEDFILCTPEGGLPLNDLFPEKLRNEDQQRIIQSHSEQENPVLVKYVFKNEG